MIFIGVDLGQKRDHSAVAVVERMEAVRAWQSPAFAGVEVRHLERMPLGMPYPLVVARVKEIVVAARKKSPCALVVDATGVGAPVVDLMRAAGMGCEVMAVSITGGDKAGAGTVPKSDLVAGLQVLLEQGQLKLPGKLRETQSLVRELMDMRMRVSGTGKMRMGADGYGEHDDLAMALALGCWKAGEKRTVGEKGGRLL